MIPVGEVVVISPRARSDARFALRIIEGDPKPAVAKFGAHWTSWDGAGHVRPHRTWRGALRSVMT